MIHAPTPLLDNSSKPQIFAHRVIVLEVMDDFSVGCEQIAIKITEHRRELASSKALNSCL